MINGYLGYTKGLTDYVIEKTNSSERVKAQVADKEIDLITGKKFKSSDYVEPTDSAKIMAAKASLENIDDKQRTEAARFLLAIPSDEEIAETKEKYLDPANRQELMSWLIQNREREG